MTDIVTHESLWACSILPEGMVEDWLVSDGEDVSENQPLVLVRLEDATHEITAPAAGRVSIATPVNGVVEPGSVLGQVLALAE